MTTVRIEYRDEGYEKESAHGEFDNAVDAVEWVVMHLAGWCVDEDVRVYIDGERFW